MAIRQNRKAWMFQVKQQLGYARHQLSDGGHFLNEPVLEYYPATHIVARE
jgi:hypothetical protein